MDYKRLYFNIIDRSKSEHENRKQNKATGFYYEKHHIIPKCLGGNNSKDNIALLTAKEHFLCHILLTKIDPKNPSLWYSLWAMCNKSNKYRNLNVSSRIYEECRLKYSELQTGRSSPMKGKTHSEKTKEKISKNRKGIKSWDGLKHSDESKKKMSQSAKNRQISKDNESLRRSKISKKLKGTKKPIGFSENLSLSRTGDKNPMYGKKSKMKGKTYEKIACEKCKKMYSKTVMNRHLKSCSK